MAISRLLYSSQTALITVGGHLYNNSGTWDFRTNVSDVVKNSYNSGTDGSGTPAQVTSSGFDRMRNFLLPIQSISADETIPQEDVLVLGKLGGAARVQKDVASSKVTIKAYLADYMRWVDTPGTFYDDGIFKFLQAKDGSAATAIDADWDGVSRQTGYQTGEQAGDTRGKDFPGDDSGTAQTTPAGLQQYETNQGPWPGITQKGMLAGEAIIQNGTSAAAIAKMGMIEQLAWESMGGFESLVQLFRPEDVTPDKDGFSFFGIMSSLSIDASKGAYPTLDMSFEGVGELEYVNMGTTDDAGTAVDGSTAYDWYVDACNPHTSDDVLIWGREKEFNHTTGAIENGASGVRMLIAGNKDSLYQDEGWIANGTVTAADVVGDASTLDDLEVYLAGMDGTAGRVATDVGQGDTDVISSAKFSYDMPTETLSSLGGVIEGKSTAVRKGNQTFSKPPYKASMTLDGQGLIMAGWEKVASGVITEQVVPNELQIGDLHSVIGAANAAVSSRSFSQNVGDVGATYNVAIEGTSATFFGTYQDQDRDIA